VAVVVTYNRRQMLLQALAAIRAQSRVPDAIIVVDNASTDGTADLLRAEFSEVDAVVLPRNTGGAGGFAVGISRALGAGAEVIWLMDDDTEPAPTALDALLAARDTFSGRTPVIVASRVVWTDGRDHPMNTPRRRPFATRRARAAAAAIGCIPIRSASFVSILIDSDATRRLGLPRADYFLWNDDFEFTTRLLRHDTGLLCPASVVTHKTAAFGATDADPGERFFYEVRNKIWMLTAPNTLGLVERGLYAGSTVRRWVRTLLRSSDRRVLRHAFRRGLAAGLRTKPRPTEELLAELGYAEDRSG